MLTAATRFPLILIASASLFLVSTLTAPSATALEFSILRLSSSAGSNPLSIGDSVTIHVGLTNLTGNTTELTGIGLEVAGYDESIVDFTSAEVVTSFFNTFVAPGGASVGGFVNLFGPLLSSADEHVGLNGPGPSVLLFAGFSLAPINGDGSLDVGVGGIPVANGGAHAVVQFTITGPGLTEIRFTGDGPGSGVVGDNPVELFAPVEASLFLGTGVVVPEPGTALLMGLGLAGLAARRRA